MHTEQPADRRPLTQLKTASTAAAVVLVGVLALTLVTDPLVNRFIKPAIVNAFAKACPGYSMHIARLHYRILTNRFEFDSVAVTAENGTLSGTVGSISLSGINRMHLLSGGKLGPEEFARAELDVRGIGINFPTSHYRLHGKRLRVSAPDSTMSVDSLELHPSAGDEEFFRQSNYSTTRLSLSAPRCAVFGLACLDLLRGNGCTARSVRITDELLDVLVNCDKPKLIDRERPLMPTELLSAIKSALRIDSIRIVNGRLYYGERFAVGAKPARVTWDDMQVLAEGIANHGNRGAAIGIHAQATFMKAGLMKVALSIPVASPDFSFRYSGSLGNMDIGALNAYLETGEHIRIKAGVNQEAVFAITVVAGHASGSVQAHYHDLAFALMNEKTGSEKGIADRFTSFIANNFNIRRSNMPDKAGPLKIGVVNYTRKRDDPFFRFAWFSLRSGLKDVIGF